MKWKLMCQCLLSLLPDPEIPSNIFSYIPLESCKQQPIVLKIFIVSLCFGLPLNSASFLIFFIIVA